MKESAVRTRIVEVASRLFYEQGYNSTGINQIIEESEIARASLYHHFSSKSELLLAYLNNAETEWFTELNAYLAPFKDPREKILAMFDFRMKRQLTQKFGGCQFVKISAEVSADDKAVLAIVNHKKERLRTYIKELVNQIADLKGALGADLLAESIFLLMEGASVTASISKNPEAMMAAKQIIKNIL